MLIFTHWVVQGGTWGHPGVVVVTSPVTVTRSRISCYQQPTRPLFPPSLLTPFIKEREEKWECLNVTTPESLKKSTLAKSASLLWLPRLWKLHILRTPHLPLLVRGCQSYPSPSICAVSVIWLGKNMLISKLIFHHLLLCKSCESMKLTKCWIFYHTQTEFCSHNSNSWQSLMRSWEGYFKVNKQLWSFFTGLGHKVSIKEVSKYSRDFKIIYLDIKVPRSVPSLKVALSLQGGSIIPALRVRKIPARSLSAQFWLLTNQYEQEGCLTVPH